MKRTSIAVAVLIALTLTGCSGIADEAGDESLSPVATETATQPATPTPSETPEAVPTATVATVTTTPAEEAFLAVTLPDLASWGTRLTEQVALDAGRDACEQIAALPAGSTIADRYKIQPLPGDTEAANGVIVREAITHFCP